MVGGCVITGATVVGGCVITGAGTAEVLPAMNDGFALIVDAVPCWDRVAEVVVAICDVVVEETTLCDIIDATGLEVCVVPRAVDDVDAEVGYTIGLPLIITL